MVAWQAMECHIDLRCMLFDGPVWLFGDNKSVFTSSAIPHSTLLKHWNALTCHCVQEAIDSGWLCFEHFLGKENPVDMLTNLSACHMLRVFVQPLHMWKGNEMEAGASAPSGCQGSGINPERSNADLGLGQTQDLVETVTNTNCDLN